MNNQNYLEYFTSDEYIDSILKSGKWSSHGSDIEVFLEEKSYCDFYPEELIGLSRKKVLTSEVFKEYLRDWIPKRLNYIDSELSRDVKGFPLEILRTVYLTDDEVTSLIKGEKRDVGKYWSTHAPELYGAGPEKGEGKSPYTVIAKVNHDDVNWLETYRSRIDFCNGDDECEIQTKEGALIDFIGLEDQFGDSLKINIAPSLFIHGSDKHLNPGTVLVSSPEDYNKKWSSNGFYKGLEANRPANYLPHNQSVFMVSQDEDLDYVGCGEESVFIVMPKGRVTRHDMSWSTKVTLLIEEGFSIESKEVSDAARNYWTGVESDNPVWEYMASEAKIIKSFSWDDDIDLDREKSISESIIFKSDEIALEL